MPYAQKARDLYARYARATAAPRKAALRALELQPEKVTPELAPIVAERREAYTRLQQEMKQVLADAREAVKYTTPAAVERSLVMTSTARQQAAASAYNLLKEASVAELVEVARDAAKRNDMALAYAVRSVLLSREQLKAQEKQPVLDALAAPHLEAHEAAIRDALGAQIVASHVELGGPFALPNAVRLMNPTNSGASHHIATTVETDSGPRKFREHDVHKIFSVEELTPPPDAAPEGSFRVLLDAVQRTERGEVLSMTLQRDSEFGFAA
jgi:hypothetical protein